MADDIDIAQERIEADIAHRIASRTVYTGISAKECEECGEDIPEDRRAAVKGVKVCAPCGALVELRAKGVRRA
jgi:phage/conjugal plasmid C-4 type zinc finger TraR family protein